MSTSRLQRLHCQLRGSRINSTNMSSSTTGNTCASCGHSHEKNPWTKEHFNKTASSYEKTTTGVTRRIFQQALRHIPTMSSATKVLDSACGPGIITELLINLVKSQSVVDPLPTFVGIDNATGMIDQFRQKQEALGWPQDRVSARIMDSEDLSAFPDNEFDIVVVNFGIFCCNDAGEGAKEIYRVLKPGGTALVTTWKHSSPMSLTEVAVGKVRPDDVAKLNPLTTDWTLAETLRSCMESGFGKGKVDIEELRESWWIESIADIKKMMEVHLCARVAKDWSEEEKALLREKLDEGLREFVENSEGMPMIAWLAVAKKA